MTSTHKSLLMAGLVILLCIVAVGLAEVTRSIDLLQTSTAPSATNTAPVAVTPTPTVPVVQTPPAPPAPMQNLSPELMSKDGVTSLVIVLPKDDVYASGTWMTNKLSHIDAYGTSTAFENQISYTVTDGNGRLLAQGPIYVSSTGAGIPGPFELHADVPRLPSTSTMVFEVHELSAKDGTPQHVVDVPIHVFCGLHGCDQSVMLYFQRGKTPSVPNDCTIVVAVKREVYSSTVVGMSDAISELLSGPTAFEISKGYSSQIPTLTTEPKLMLANGTMSLDLSSVLPSTLTSCQTSAIQAQIMSVAKWFGQDLQLLSMILAGLIVGTIAGAILLFLSYLAPYIGAGNFIPELKDTDVLGKRLTRREGQFVGMLTHLATSAVFGAFYAALVQWHVIYDFSFIRLIEWSGVMTLVVGGIIMPLEGHGLFGVKEDAWFPIDLMLTNLFWSMLFWWLIPMWLFVLGS